MKSNFLNTEEEKRKVNKLSSIPFGIKENKVQASFSPRYNFIPPHSSGETYESFKSNIELYDNAVIINPTNKNEKKSESFYGSICYWKREIFNSLNFENDCELSCTPLGFIEYPTQFKKPFRILRHHNPLSEIFSAIDNSKYICNLVEGWDDDSAMAIKEQTWEEATNFLHKYSFSIYEKYIRVIPTPEINPCRDASIDLSWRTPKGRLLINFSPKRINNAAYYGDRYNNKDSIKGFISGPEVKDYFAIWMKDYL